jgi:hypothetical protein
MMMKFPVPVSQVRMVLKVQLICLVLLCANACKKKNPEELKDQYDIFLVAGQSNTLNGIGIIPGIDSSSGGVFQLGRHGDKDFQVIEAIEPLDHWHKRPGRIGFALTFAKLYKEQSLKNGRKVLLIACGMGSTGFITNEWNKGGYLYDDAIKRVNWVIDHFPGSEFKAVLWHQGEHDVNNNLYQEQLDKMITDMRSDIKDWKAPQVFIAGGMVPFWVASDPMRIRSQGIIKSISERLPNAGFSDPYLPFLIEKPNNAYDDVHYDANGQRELGRRYFSQYLQLSR